MAVSLGLLASMGTQLDSIFNSDELATNLPADEARDLMIATMHGLTELHLANNPDLPVGKGRYGKLVEQSVDLYLAAWLVET